MGNYFTGKMSSFNDLERITKQLKNYSDQILDKFLATDVLIHAHTGKSELISLIIAISERKYMWSSLKSTPLFSIALGVELARQS